MFSISITLNKGRVVSLRRDLFLDNFTDGEEVRGGEDDDSVLGSFLRGAGEKIEEQGVHELED